MRRVPFLRRAGGGTLSFVGSVSAFTSAEGHGLYGMTKAALLSMVRTAAVELGPDGIRVNTVSPGGPGPRACWRTRASTPPCARTPSARHCVDGGLVNAWPLARPD